MEKLKQMNSYHCHTHMFNVVLVRMRVREANLRLNFFAVFKTFQEKSKLDEINEIFQYCQK